MGSYTPNKATFTVYKGSPSGTIVEDKTTRELGPKDVLVKITHSGLCGTELHVKHAPIALGHEGAGIVQEVGDQTSILKVGDRVGWGFQQGYCGQCKYCLSGQDNYCASRVFYGESNTDQGSLGSHAVWPETSLVPIPSDVPLEHAAPLMCAGATIFAVLRDYNVRPTSRVGIIGIGGLGHLAIQFAAKMGCEVVVFSSTESKRKEATALGATEFHINNADLTLDRPVDFLLVTSAAQPDFAKYIPLMARRGEIFLLSGDGQDIKIPSMTVMYEGIGVRGSIVASRQCYHEMLRFCAVHGVKPVIQTFPMTLDGVSEAFKVLENGGMRYRGVLVGADE